VTVGATEFNVVRVRTKPSPHYPPNQPTPRPLFLNSPEWWSIIVNRSSWFKYFVIIFTALRYYSFQRARSKRIDTYSMYYMYVCIV